MAQENKQERKFLYNFVSVRFENVHIQFRRSTQPNKKSKNHPKKQKKHDKYSIKAKQAKIQLLYFSYISRFFNRDMQIFNSSSPAAAGTESEKKESQRNQRIVSFLGLWMWTEVKNHNLNYFICFGRGSSDLVRDITFPSRISRDGCIYTRNRQQDVLVSVTSLPKMSLTIFLPLANVCSAHPIPIP